CHGGVTAASQASNTTRRECPHESCPKERHMLDLQGESRSTLAPAHTSSQATHYSVELARSAADILEAQRLRYRVFAEELGARLNPRVAGVDSDIYDPYCEHLIVRDEAADRIVGTYRILGPEAA